MHKSTMLRMEWFVSNYIKDEYKTVLDVGSYSVNGSYRELFAGKNIKYVGLDIEAGPNVDIVMDEPYSWTSIEDESFDYIISGQAFEHIEYPWLTIKEIYKKLVPGGVICIIAPNSTPEHRYPFDCYRYFSDGLSALAKWAGFDVLDVTVAGIPERSVSPDWYNDHNDVCLIARKPKPGMQPEETPKLKYERRFSWIEDQKLCCDFMAKWILDGNIAYRFKEFIKERAYKKIYIYGKDYIGKILYKELHGCEGIAVELIGPESSEAKDIDQGIELPDLENTEKNSCILVSLLDHDRDLQRYLSVRYPSLPSYYVDEIVNLQEVNTFFKEYKEVYLYGAGVFGKKYLDFLCRYNFNPEGFVVSNGKRITRNVFGYKVWELQELQKSRDTGFIVAVSEEIRDEVIAVLSGLGYNNFMYWDIK